MLVTPDWTLAFQIVNFIIMFIGVRWLYQQFVAPSLKARTERIAADLTNAQAEREAAAKLKEEYMQELAAARSRAQEIVDRAARQAEESTKAQLAEVRTQIEREKQFAQEEIRREREHALNALRSEVVGLSMAAAGKIVGANMTSDTNARMVDEFINKLDAEKVGNIPC